MRVSILFLAASLAGCASAPAARGPCDPVPPEFLTAGPVYRDCDVDRQAEIARPLSVDHPSRSRGMTGCFRAAVDVVIDTVGRAIPTTAKVAHSNDSRYADAVIEALRQARFRPAKRNGRTVQQLFRGESVVEYGAVVFRAGEAPPPPSGVPNC